MCFGSGGSATPTPTPEAVPDPGAGQATAMWNSRRRQQNGLTDILPTNTAANDTGSPTTALKKLMGA